MKRYAFTLLELVFVIVVIGILAVLAMPNFRGNPLQTAAEQVASHIRYTQHLAMVDDKFNPNDGEWFRGNWQVDFTSTTSNVYYTIFSDSITAAATYGGSADISEIAIDPLTGDRLSGEILTSNSDITDLKKKFGIISITFSSACNTGNELAFDALGRPYYYLTETLPTVANIYQYLLTQDCNITLAHSDGNATITIRPETGYVSVTY